MAKRRPASTPPEPPEAARLAALRRLGEQVAVHRKHGGGRAHIPSDLREQIVRAVRAAQEAGTPVAEALGLVGVRRNVVGTWPESSGILVRRRRSRGAALALRPVVTNGAGPAGPLTLTTPSGYQLSVGSVAELVDLLRALERA